MTLGRGQTLLHGTAYSETVAGPVLRLGKV